MFSVFARRQIRKQPANPQDLPQTRPVLDDQAGEEGRAASPTAGVVLRDQGEASEPAPGRAVPPVGGRHGRDDRVFFVARKQPDGTYSLGMTDEGVQTFETALGIADDLGGRTRISPYSTIADIMDRTATREELSTVLRRGGHGVGYEARVLVLRRKLRGSEKPSAEQRTIGHIGKIVILAIFALWALKQFAIAIQDIEDIPGILANIPSDILHLHPTSAFGDVGNKIADAGDHVLYGVLGACLTYLLAKLIRPFARIYRKDQLLTGERTVLRLASAGLRRVDESTHRPSQPDVSL